MSAASHEEACARVAALYPQRWLRHYASGKLRSDTVFALAFELVRNSDEPLLDVGCGVGLLPFYLRERGFGPAILGLDTDARKVQQAIRAAQSRYEQVEFVELDVRDELPAFCGNVALLDVLHYLEPTRQGPLLSTLAQCVPAEGTLFLRDAPREGTARFWITYACEIFAQTISWNLRTPLHFATREAITAPFDDAGFTREEQPAHGGGPFNNRLFVFRRRQSAVAPAGESQNDTRASAGVAGSTRDTAR